MVIKYETLDHTPLSEPVAPCYKLTIGNSGEIMSRVLFSPEVQSELPLITLGNITLQSENGENVKKIGRIWWVQKATPLIVTATADGGYGPAFRI